MSSVFAMSAQKQTKQATDDFSSLPNAKELRMEAVMVVEPGFPTGEFSISNANYFITSFQKWSESNKSHYADLLANTNVKSTRITLLNAGYYQLSPDRQAAYKQFLEDMDKYLSMQNSIAGSDKKIYLFSEADFNKLQSIITK
jgi:hypothetical protein